MGKQFLWCWISKERHLSVGLEVREVLLKEVTSEPSLKR